MTSTWSPTKGGGDIGPEKCGTAVVTTRILVTGATGTLGREVVRQLADGGRVVRALSRRPRPTGQPAEIEWAVGDLGTGEGIDAAVADVDTIIHCASDYRRARKDLPGVRRFLDAARDAGVAHLVYISIVGIDQVPLSYYRVKLDEERLIQSSGLAWTILRTTQFHDLVRRIAAALARLPVMVVPSISVQPIDTREVAARLVELAAGRPRGRVADLGGPQVALSGNWPCPTCGRAASAACCCRCACPVRPSAATSKAGTWPPITQRAAAPSRSTSHSNRATR